MFEVAKKTIMPYKTVNNLRRIGHFAWYFFVLCLYRSKNASEWSKFLRFYLYFYHAVLMNCYFFTPLS